MFVVSMVLAQHCTALCFTVFVLLSVKWTGQTFPSIKSSRIGTLLPEIPGEEGATSHQQQPHCDQLPITLSPIMCVFVNKSHFVALI
jgi:hypothetical protein